VASRTLYDYITKGQQRLVDNVHHNYSLLKLKNIVNSQKNKITYTHDYVNMLLNNDVIKLFYTDQDIEMFRKVNYKNE
jgi:hypothetical protein